MLKKIKKFFRSGNGEIMGFVLCMPCLIFLFCIIIDTVLMSLTKQDIEYISYAAGRSAVVCTDYATGDDRAERVVAKGTDGTITYYMKILDEDNNSTDEWKKGNFVLITVTKDIDTILKGKQTISSKVVMMIERGQ